MEVVIALGHFCDTHGPCIILCTDKVQALPHDAWWSSNTSVCNACQSIDQSTIYNCENGNCHYISTRTSLNPQVMHWLNDAVLRSLSVEVVQEEGKDSGTMYFGDNQRGHVISHLFDIKDSLARGFKRKYCIIVFSKHQIPLLHHYSFIEKNLKQISSELQEKANRVNVAEQLEKSQRADRQSVGTNYKLKLRSLPYLLGEVNVFAHLHLWFVFLLKSELYKSIPHDVPECPVDCSNIKELREVHNEMPSDIFQTISYCILTGIKVEEDQLNVVKYFKQLLPVNFVLPESGTSCKIAKKNNVWDAHFKGSLPKKLPRLQISIQTALSNKNIPDISLGYHLMSNILRWFNVACVLSWVPNPNEKLIGTLEVHNCDMPLLSYWISQSNKCVKLCDTDYFTKCGNNDL